MSPRFELRAQPSNQSLIAVELPYPKTKFELLCDEILLDFFFQPAVEVAREQGESGFEIIYDGSLGRKVSKGKFEKTTTDG